MDVETFTAEMDRVTSPDAIWRLSMAFFHARSLPRVAYLHMPPAGAPDAGQNRLRQEGFPDAWITLYVGERLYRVDPNAVFSMQSAQPFFWSDIANLKRITPGEQRYLDMVADADLGDGLGVQAFGPAARNGYCAFGLDPDTSRPRGFAVRELQWVCQLAHLKYCTILTETLTKPIALTPRERDVLEWIARGKSNTVIGDVLGLSANTVDTHVRRIFLKLDVGDRVSAALVGLGLGFIHGGA